MKPEFFIGMLMGLVEQVGPCEFVISHPSVPNNKLYYARTLFPNGELYEYRLNLN